MHPITGQPVAGGPQLRGVVGCGGRQSQVLHLARATSRVRRIAHVREEWGSWIEEDRRLTAIDRRAEDVTIAGLCDTLRKGHHHLFKRAIHRLERDLALSVL